MLTIMQYVGMAVVVLVVVVVVVSAKGLEMVYSVTNIDNQPSPEGEAK